jgi:hypothetical protein
MTAGGDNTDLGFAKLLKGCYVYGAPECVPDLNRKIAFLQSGQYTTTLADLFRKIKSAAGGAQEIAVVGYPFLFQSAGFYNDLHADAHCPWMNGDSAQVLARFRQGQQLMDSAMSSAANEVGARRPRAVHGGLVGSRSRADLRI